MLAEKVKKIYLFDKAIPLQGPFSCAGALSNYISGKCCFQDEEEWTFILTILYLFIFYISEQAVQQKASLSFAKLISAWRLLHPSPFHKRQFVAAAHHQTQKCFIMFPGFIEEKVLLLFLKHFIRCCIVSKDCSNFSHFWTAVRPLSLNLPLFLSLSPSDTLS